MIAIPGAKKITQWFPWHDDKRVYRDYISGPCGDIDIDSWFMIATAGPHIYVRPGDYIVDMEDGTVMIKQKDCIELGDIGDFGGVLAKVTKIEGGLLELTTPHGTVITTGFVWMADKWKWPLSQEKFKQYKDWEKDAALQKKLAAEAST